MARSLTDKVRDKFGYDTIIVERGEIRVYWMKGADGREWVPYGGGPLYRDSAQSHVRWLARHLHEYRQFLPKSIREYPIVIGELDTRTYPGRFFPSPTDRRLTPEDWTVQTA